jgi:tetratricopeptide (TPR) repeat protein
MAPLFAPARAAKGASTGAKYAEVCAQGNAKVGAHDLPAAIVLYRSAIDLDPKNPLAYYLVGEAELAGGNIAGAEADFEHAAAESGEHDPAQKARALFVLADLKERQWKWAEAKAAWQAYLDWASRFPNGTFPESARSRQQAIDTMLKQDKAYEVVRRRIAETKDGGVYTDLSK